MGWVRLLSDRWAFRLAALALLVALTALAGLIWAVTANALQPAVPVSMPTPESESPQTASWGVSAPPVETFQLTVAVVVAYVEAVAADEARLWAKWRHTNLCEESGQWYAHGYGGNGSYYEGGLGLGRDQYIAIAGHSALLDSPVAQMRIAEVVLARQGPGNWTGGCGPS